MVSKVIALAAGYLGFRAAVSRVSLPKSYLLSFEDMCTQQGYTVQSHSVTTKDGYILKLFRLGKEKISQGPPVLLVHGMTQTSNTYIVNKTSTAPAFALANQDFDVWLLNTRGNCYSRHHTELKPENPKYWDWTAYDISVKDIPATFDYILNNTGYKKINYVGNSQGGHVLLNCLSYLPEYNDKVGIASLLCPVGGTITPKAWYFRKLIHPMYTDYLSALKKDLVADHCPSGSYAAKLAYKFPGLVEKISKDRYNLSITGDSNLNLAFYIQHRSGGTSLLNCKYYGQLSSNKNPLPLAYDYGSSDLNMKKYGSEIPPKANYDKITAKLALFYGLHDQIVSPKDAEKLFLQLNKDNVVYRQFDCNLDHAGFLISNNQDHMSKIIELLKLHKLNK